MKINNLIGSFNNVHLIKQETKVEVRKFYKIANIFVCTSLYKPLGLVIQGLCLI
jgi:hypothetical protein